MDDLGEFEEDTKDLELLAGINHIIEKHAKDPTPKPHKIAPDHPDLVQHDDAPGFWHPDVSPEMRKQLMEEMKSLHAHDKAHGDPGIIDPDCAWCRQSFEMNRCPKTGCMAGYNVPGTERQVDEVSRAAHHLAMVGDGVRVPASAPKDVT